MTDTSDGELGPPCDVTWCQIRELGHNWHQGDHRFVQGDVAASQDSPEHEGVILHVAIEGDTDRPRLGIAVTGVHESLAIRLDVEATDYVRGLLTGIGGSP